MEIFEFISYKDLLDILGASLFVYAVLYFLRITKGIQILKGLIFGANMGPCQPFGPEDGFHHL